MAQPKDFLLKEIIHPILPFRFTGQDVDKDYAFLDGILAPSIMLKYSAAWEEAPRLQGCRDGYGGPSLDLNSIQ